jgi:bifunctional DNA-binding transcriptional regulator/antitoxin component of YhaV-PrlF toxin-antitoxin module
MNTQARPHSRPAAGTATARVWELADAISARAGRKARRREVVEAYAAEGGNPNTASTQYYYWSRAQEPAATPARAGGSLRLTVDGQGRVTLPPEVLEGIELGPDGRVTARLLDGELRLITPRVALRRLRAIARRLGPGESVVDEFIAEKRREAARE